MTKRNDKVDKWFDVLGVMGQGWDDVNSFVVWLVLEVLLLCIIIIGAPLYVIGALHLKLFPRKKEAKGR